MNNEDKIRELFAEKLGNLEAPVNPELWGAISSQIGTSAAVTSTGLSIVAKTIIGISAATVIGVSTYFIASNSDEEQQPQTQQTSQLITEEKTPTSESLAEKEVVETVKEQEKTNETKNNIVREEVSHSTINHIVPIHKPLDILLDNHTFITDLTPDLTQQAKTEPIIVPPVKNEINTKDKHEQIGSNNADLGQELKPSFELTHLPNIYGLYAGGYFSIDYNGAYSDFQITILDSRNNVVFSSDRPDFEWRGSDLSGNQVEPGKYVYIITAKDLNGNAINKYSPLTVINQ